MARPINKNEYDEILHGLALYPQGASLQEIRHTLKTSREIYTLRRRLAFLVDSGKVQIEGKTRSLRYKLLPQTGDAEDQKLAKNETIETIFLSPNAKLIQEKINKPITARTPVGYNRKFLDLYRPNETRYLSESTSNRLIELGKTDGDKPSGTYAREIYSRILIDLSWNSSRLEGNTYSILETERLLNLSEAAEGKELTETQMILNHKMAIEFLIDSAEEIDINRRTVLSVHALLADNLLKDPNACGSVRTKMIQIGKSVYHPLIVPNVINECFDQILDTAKAIRDPIEQAFFLMVHLPYLQPFEDVNKRVSRLVANIPLIRLNLSPLTFVDVPQKIYISSLLAIYELNQIDILKDVFIWAYERSCALYSATRQTLGDPDPFRMRYRQQIMETVTRIVRAKMDKKMAVKSIKIDAELLIPSNERQRFITTVEIELRGLHEGNCARYRLRSSEYNEWHANWK